MSKRQYEEFASVSNLELEMMAESILNYCGMTPTEESINKIVGIVRQPIYKCVDVTNEWFKRQQETEAEKERVEHETKRKLEEETKSSLIPDDYESNDNLLLAFGIMQLLLYRMGRVNVDKYVSLKAFHNTGDSDNLSVEIPLNKSAVFIDHGKVKFKDSYNDLVFELIQPDSIEKIVDRIFLDS